MVPDEFRYACVSPRAPLCSISRHRHKPRNPSRHFSGAGEGVSVPVLCAFRPVGGDVGNHSFPEGFFLERAGHVAHVQDQAVHLQHPHHRIPADLAGQAPIGVQAIHLEHFPDRRPLVVPGGPLHSECLAQFVGTQMRFVLRVVKEIDEAQGADDSAGPDVFPAPGEGGGALPGQFRGEVPGQLGVLLVEMVGANRIGKPHDGVIFGFDGGGDVGGGFFLQRCSPFGLGFLKMQASSKEARTGRRETCPCGMRLAAREAGGFPPKEGKKRRARSGWGLESHPLRRGEERRRRVPFAPVHPARLRKGNPKVSGIGGNGKRQGQARQANSST